ncbi:MAG: hypothetical protein V1882_05690 [Candidatus Omnitrophota bacterium]
MTVPEKADFHKEGLLGKAVFQRTGRPAKVDFRRNAPRKATSTGNVLLIENRVDPPADSAMATNLFYVTGKVPGSFIHNGFFGNFFPQLH